MRTISNQLNYLIPNDIRTIAEQTYYSTKTVYALLSGSRRPTKRNQIVFELAYKLAEIRQNNAERTEKEIESYLKKFHK